MHIAKSLQILCFLLSHSIAAYTPRGVPVPPSQVSRTSGALDVRDSSNITTLDGSTSIVEARQDGGSCDRKARCKKNKIRNPLDETKCMKCPPLMKPDPTKTICVKDDDLNKDDKKKQYQDKIKEKIKELFDKFKQEAKDRVKNKMESKQKEWEEKNKQRQDKRNQKKFRRMAACSPAVAASIGTVAMLEMADGGFSEDLFDSIDMDMLEFWPKDDIVDDFLDKLPEDEDDLTKEDYVKEFLEVGDAAAGKTKRAILARRDEFNGTVTTTNPDDGDQTVHKDNIFTTIINAFKNLVRIIVTAARARGATGAASRVTKYFSDGKTPNLKKPGESKFTRAQQKTKAKEISQDKNWKKCLRGEKPEK